MQRPATAESVWLDLLADLPYWQPPIRPTLVISPHPDDETLGAGGLIAAQRGRGMPVRVVAVTDGEAVFPDWHGLGDSRRREQEQALAHLGVDAPDILRLRLPDGGVPAHEEELLEEIRFLTASNTLLVAPWQFDPHPDHEVCGRVAEQIASETGALLVSYFFWSWHHHAPEMLRALKLGRFELTRGQMQAREAALAQYRTQRGAEGRAPVLPDVLLAPARRPFETFLLRG